MMAMRSEDRDARQNQQTFADGATLAELEKHLAFLRSLGAPGDAHPRVGVNDDYEITWMACVVERRIVGRAAGCEPPRTGAPGGAIEQHRPGPCFSASQ